MKPESATSRITRYIKENPGSTPVQMSKGTGLSLTHTQRICRNLHGIKATHITAWTVRAGCQDPHYTYGPGIDVARIPNRDRRRTLERQTGHKIISTEDIPNRGPAIHPWTARYLGLSFDS